MTPAPTERDTLAPSERGPFRSHADALRWYFAELDRASSPQGLDPSRQFIDGSSSEYRIMNGMRVDVAGVHALVSLQVRALDRAFGESLAAAGIRPPYGQTAAESLLRWAYASRYKDSMAERNGWDAQAAERIVRPVLREARGLLDEAGLVRRE